MSSLARLKHNSLFRVTAGLRDKHDYRKDSAFTGDYLVRLPDRSLVKASEYQERLAEYEAGLASGERK